MNPHVKQEDVTFEVELRINATINGFKGNVTEQELKELIIKEVKKEIQDTYKEGLKLDVDIFRLSEYLYRDNVKAWKSLRKMGKFHYQRIQLVKLMWK